MEAFGLADAIGLKLDAQDLLSRKQFIPKENRPFQRLPDLYFRR